MVPAKTGVALSAVYSPAPLPRHHLSVTSDSDNDAGYNKVSFSNVTYGAAEVTAKTGVASFAVNSFPRSQHQSLTNDSNNDAGFNDVRFFWQKLARRCLL